MPMEGIALQPAMGINRQAVYVYHNEFAAYAAASLQEVLRSEGGNKTAQPHRIAFPHQHAHQTRDGQL